MTEQTLRRRADRLGYKISRGYSRYLGSGVIATDNDGNRHRGYNVIDLHINCMVWDCYNEVYDHLFSLEDVFQFLKDADQEREFIW